MVGFCVSSHGLVNQLLDLFARLQDQELFPVREPQNAPRLMRDQLVLRRRRRLAVHRGDVRWGHQDLTSIDPVQDHQKHHDQGHVITLTAYCCGVTVPGTSTSRTSPPTISAVGVASSTSRTRPAAVAAGTVVSSTSRWVPALRMSVMTRP